EGRGLCPWEALAFSLDVGDHDRWSVELAVVPAVEEVERLNVDLRVSRSAARARNATVVDDGPAAVSERLQNCLCPAPRGPSPARGNCGTEEHGAREDAHK